MSESPSWYGERESEKDSERGDLASIMYRCFACSIYARCVCLGTHSLELPRASSRSLAQVPAEDTSSAHDARPSRPLHTRVL